MSKEYKNINSDKFKSIGQKEVEQMNGTREMSNEERKQSRRKKKRVGGDAMRHRQGQNKCNHKTKNCPNIEWAYLKDSKKTRKGDKDENVKRIHTETQ